MTIALTLSIAQILKVLVFKRFLKEETYEAIHVDLMFLTCMAIGAILFAVNLPPLPEEMIAAIMAFAGVSLGKEALKAVKF